MQNKKSLIVFWTIILLGFGFIAYTNLIQEDKKAPLDSAKEKPLDNETPLSPASEATPEIKIIEQSATKNPPISREQNTKTFPELISEANSAESRLLIPTAIKIYEEALTLDSQNLELINKLGNLYITDNQPLKAKEAFIKAQELSKNSTQSQINVARAELANRQIEAAKNIVWQLDQNNYEVKYYAAIILILYKDLEGAKKLFKQIAEAPTPEPNKEKALLFLKQFEKFDYFKEEDPLYLKLLLAQSLNQVEESNSSIPLLFDIINQKNNYRDAWIVLGYAYLKTNKINDAIDSLSKAIDLDPEKPETLFYLGLAYFANDEIDKSIFYLEKAKKFNFKPQDILNMKLGDIYLLNESYKKSARQYEEAIAANPTLIEAYIRSTWINIEHLKNISKANEISEQAIKAFPQEAISYNLAGWSKLVDGNYDQAKEYLEKAIKINPNLELAYLNMGTLYEEKNITNLAEEYYLQAKILGNGNTVSQIAEKNYHNLQLKPDKEFIKASILNIQLQN